METPIQKEWFLYVVDHHEGPFTAAEIRARIEEGQAKTSSFVWKEGFADWMMMADIPELGGGGPGSDSHGQPGFLMPAGQTGPDLGGVSASASVWCLSSRKVFSGPHSMKTIVRKLNEGAASPQDSVWKEGWTSFVPISNISEFMTQVKTDSNSGKKSKKMGAAAAALGLAGGASTRAYKWYRSTKFFVCFTLLVLVALYQALSHGYLNPLLEKTPLKDKVAALHLVPIPFEKIPFEKIPFDKIPVDEIKSSALPLLNKGIALLPDPLRKLLSRVKVPENVSPTDAETLRETAGSDLATGIHVSSALPLDDIFNPAFVVASNAADGTRFTATLKGRPGMLLSAAPFEQTVSFDIHGHVGQTPKFALDGNKPLPRGEYILSVSGIDQGKKPFATDFYFLGGKKDAAFTQRIKEFNDRIKTRTELEQGELKQMTLTLESMANESASKFFTLSAAPNTVQRKNLWKTYHVRYVKMSGQLKDALAKAQASVPAAEHALPQLYLKLGQAQAQADRLHETETNFIEKGGRIDDIRAQAAPTLQSLSELKQALGGVK